MPRDRRPWSSFALVALLLALSVRLVVPQGYMLTPADGGLIRISVCSGQGAMEMGLTRDGDLVELPDEEPKSDAPECPYALALSPALDVPPQTLPALPVPSADATTITAVHQRPGLGLAAPPPPSHAPPTLLT